MFSGGKDSTYTAYLMLKKHFQVVLVSVISEKYSLMFHYPNIKWCKLQAKVAGLKHYVLKAKKENELEVLKNFLKKLKIDAIAAGAIYSTYQKSRIEKLAKELGLKTFFPLWQKKPDFLKKMLKEMEVYITAVAAEGLDKTYLAKRFLPEDVDKFLKLNPPINVFLEGGEGETFVAYAPFFKKKIKILKWKKYFSKTSGFAYIAKATIA
ncbi:MAG: diphthine--ammonia ligase [Candidatus Micrarchaeota archaeon]|nr:diphthine--ammonia ligase [Candidatus Micrarchaeota archaeon]